MGMYAESSFRTWTCRWGYLLTILNSEMLWQFLLPVSCAELWNACVLVSLAVNGVSWWSLMLPVVEVAAD
jgi:hypothetical protein